MKPKITGIALYPLEWEVSTGGRIPATTNDINKNRCSSSCEVPFAQGINHNLICAGNKEGDFDHVSVLGEIVPIDDAHTDSWPLDEMRLEKRKTGTDGSYRVFWTWPNTGPFMVADASYDIALTLIKRGDAFGSDPKWEEKQGPFKVTLRPPPEPIVPKPK